MGPVERLNDHHAYLTLQGPHPANSARSANHTGNPVELVSIFWLMVLQTVLLSFLTTR